MNALSKYWRRTVPITAMVSTQHICLSCIHAVPTLNQKYSRAVNENTVTEVPTSPARRKHVMNVHQVGRLTGALSRRSRSVVQLT